MSQACFILIKEHQVDNTGQFESSLTTFAFSKL